MASKIWHFIPMALESWGKRFETWNDYIFTVGVDRSDFTVGYSELLAVAVWLHTDTHQPTSFTPSPFPPAEVRASVKH